MGGTTVAQCRMVAYYRVSTDKQGESGLGLEAQQALVENYASQTGCEVIASFTEVESGKRADRPEIARALAHAKRHKARLVIATLSRLGRKVHFISGLMESGVDFVTADAPNDDRFVTHIKAAVSEDEGLKVSQRTKAALAALKARGVKLGTPANLTGEAQAKGSQANRDKAITAYALVMPTIRQMRSEGLSLASIADGLNARGISTRTGDHPRPGRQLGADMIQMTSMIPGLPTVADVHDWLHRVREAHPEWPVERIMAELRRLPDLDPDAIREAARLVYLLTDG